MTVEFAYLDTIKLAALAKHAIADGGVSARLTVVDNVVERGVSAKQIKAILDHVKGRARSHPCDHVWSWKRLASRVGKVSETHVFDDPDDWPKWSAVTRRIHGEVSQPRKGVGASIDDRFVSVYWESAVGGLARSRMLLEVLQQDEVSYPLEDALTRPKLETVSVPEPEPETPTDWTKLTQAVRAITDTPDMVVALEVIRACADYLETEGTK